MQKTLQILENSCTEFFFLYELIGNSTRIIFSFDENFFCVWSSSLEIGFTMVTLLKPITPVAPRYEPNLYRRGVTALADLMITIEMLLAPHNSRETLFFGGPLKVVLCEVRVVGSVTPVCIRVFFQIRAKSVTVYFIVYVSFPYTYMS